MSELSPNFALPYMQSSQAQKHVTHNEALERLDVLAQLALEGFATLTPPAAPTEGEAHGIGAGATGVWAGQDGRIAAWLGGTWVFIDPGHGWRAWGRAEAELRAWDGAAWTPVTGDMTNLDGVGIGAAWDSVNRLAVASDAALFTHAGGGHQLKINKASSGDTGSILYQTNWSGRAEMGLAASDDFAVKVSDGTDWFEALRIDHATGGVALPSGRSDMPVFSCGVDDPNKDFFNGDLLTIVPTTDTHSGQVDASKYQVPVTGTYFLSITSLIRSVSGSPTNIKMNLRANNLKIQELTVEEFVLESRSMPVVVSLAAGDIVDLALVVQNGSAPSVRFWNATGWMLYRIGA
ncbi:DUF2793 domain-containing protein [Ponticoccus sp. SC2-23]|uniref:DUF2793 domain-containing protein n=1 Tax=Alexandriicola marinus TaxID=2081710 RepID=UPI000FDB3EBC|nr:DUF2793 domain-containing protein [Alexandriicola marinus]MBM1222494.1 DUF2793 domain-containing protein [Ponticoccus sp. SC6-9]MBM1227000.1 DUF2793 domain-containing protein [Ponticoccus sp. SC6-15]MBM1231421.1 DUF2793 domain-containing protein [Ponticoccus sp. SC6-38]MBM1235994.1 DUF2793 domain-containing protein [Ponticoccus sp. SC6-45]MBM1240444.1 DUF2793 domain-containing protein [Ponticoccus sp. SC6-49]MBM1244979.1 DUF2793 domain-containing protein [Ponticoccus sp. SC2-64]MBM1249468